MSRSRKFKLTHYTLTAANPLGWKGRAEFVGGEGMQGAEARGKLEVGEAAVAAERPEKISGGKIAFVDVASLTAGNEIAAGIVAELRTWDDVIEAAG